MRGQVLKARVQMAMKNLQMVKYFQLNGKTCEVISVIVVRKFSSFSS